MQTMNLKKYSPKIGTVAWICAVCAYFFQFPFPTLASLIIPCLFLFFLTQIPYLQLPKNKLYLTAVAVYCLVIAAGAIRSLLAGVPVSRILRFAAILVGIPVFCWIRNPEFDGKKCFLWIAAAKSLLLILIAAKLVIEGDHTVIRNLVLSKGLGDIYLLNGIPKVQVHGNALLVMAFILDFCSRKRISPLGWILLAGVLAAGNFAFVLGLVLVFGWKGCVFAVDFLKRDKNAKYWIAAIAALALVILMPYVIRQIQLKAQHSNVIRWEQAQVLLDTNLLMGDGLGAIVQATTSGREYKGDMYFEMQTLYIVRQIGLIGIVLFYWITCFQMYHRSLDRLLVYLIYLIYAFWNPYCFDVTHMMTVVLILNFDGLGVDNEKSTYYSVQSFFRGQWKHIFGGSAGR